jgi:cytochrome d ubiquinol oxidase subunit I
MDALLLARIQFALTVGFHFIFPPISIGLAWMLVIVEWLGWRRNDPDYVRAGKLFGRLLAVTFAAGVASGIVMEFQFGTNWARYSTFVGDIFGAPLAAEGLFAFFLESTFLGVYLFGRNRVSKRLHWFSAFMVAVGSTLSAFWIIVANSWQQTPTAYVLRNGRAELTDFWAAVFNPSTLPRYFHTVDAALITGAFVMAGVSAYHLLKNPETPFARKAMRIAVISGLVFSLAEVMPLGHWHARQVAETQPAKFAAIEGLYETQTGAPMAVFGFPSDRPPALKAPIEIPGLLSWLAFGSVDAEVKGVNDFPLDERPPLWLTFVSFHNMVALGMWFIAVMAAAVVQLARGKLWTSRWLLKALVYSIPLPVAACQLGWVAAEVGRQPWIVQGLMRTSEAHSSTVTAGEVLFSLIMFGVIYALLGSLWLFLMIKKARQVPADSPASPSESIPSPAPAQA